jgi:hypothetical protein
VLAIRHATPYHAPVYLAQKLGFFADEGIKVALLEPNDPSDVTEIIGSGKVDMGFKAMIHTLAAKARGFPVTSIGSLLDEPFTGVVYLKDSGITPDFRSLKGKKIGYVGEFGKVIFLSGSLALQGAWMITNGCHDGQIQIDELTKHYGMEPSDYEAVRCGMNVSKAIIEGSIDAGIGLENVQMVELEEWLAGQGRARDEVKMLRIDELAELGCCCFCSILYIGVSFPFPVVSIFVLSISVLSIPGPFHFLSFPFLVLSLFPLFPFLSFPFLVLSNFLPLPPSLLAPFFPLSLFLSPSSFFLLPPLAIGIGI